VPLAGHLGRVTKNKRLQNLPLQGQILQALSI